MAITSHTSFQRLMTDCAAHAEEQGWKLDGDARTAAEGWIAAKVEQLSQHLGAGAETVLTNYYAAFDTKAIAAAIKEALEARERQLAEAQPAEVTLAEAGRLVASLGRVSWIASFDKKILKSVGSRAQAANLLAIAADAMSGIGLAISASAREGLTETVELPGDVVLWARMALKTTVDNIRQGRWSCGSPGLNEAVPIGMLEDLSPLLQTDEQLVTTPS